MAPGADKAIELGVKAGLTVVESSILGAFAILALGVGVAGVWLAFRTQNARVDDQKKLSEKIEALINEQNKLNTSTTLALSQLNSSGQQHNAALGAINTNLTALHTTMSSIMQGLVSRGR